MSLNSGIDHSIMSLSCTWQLHVIRFMMYKKMHEDQIDRQIEWIRCRHVRHDIISSGRLYKGLYTWKRTTSLTYNIITIVTTNIAIIDVRIDFKFINAFWCRCRSTTIFVWPTTLRPLREDHSTGINYISSICAIQDASFFMQAQNLVLSSVYSACGGVQKDSSKDLFLFLYSKR